MSFEDRQRAYEGKFANEEVTEFRVRALRNRLLGDWMAEQLDLSGDAAQTYTQQIIDMGTNPAREDALRAKLRQDLADKGIEMSDHRLARRMEELEGKARDQLHRS
jgi:hypothetical protein